MWELGGHVWVGDEGGKARRRVWMWDADVGVGLGNGNEEMRILGVRM